MTDRTRTYRGITSHRRKTVYVRDDFTCQACGYRPTNIPERYDGRYTLGGVGADGKIQILEIDHVVPVVRDGRFTVDNLQTLCNRCNARKGATV